MQIGAINSFGAASGAQNNLSFKGWRDDKVRIELPDVKYYDEYSRCEFTRPGGYREEKVNEHWQDAAGYDERIKKYAKDRTEERPVDHLNAISSLLEQRAIKLNQKAQDFQAASVECAEEAKNLKQEALDRTKSGLQEAIDAKRAELEALLAQMNQLEGKN